MLLTLDVGFKNMGWALMENGCVIKYGVFTTEKAKKKTTRTADDYAWRSAALTSQLEDCIKENGVKGVVGELPSGGAQNAKAMAQMNMATAIVSTACQILKIPCEWTTPGDVKMAVTGRKAASKEEIMDTVRNKLFPHIVWPDCAAKFEHIADAIGAYLALKNGNLVRMFG